MAAISGSVEPAVASRVAAVSRRSWNRKSATLGQALAAIARASAKRWRKVCSLKLRPIALSTMIVRAVQPLPTRRAAAASTRCASCGSAGIDARLSLGLHQPNNLRVGFPLAEIGRLQQRGDLRRRADEARD